VFPEFPDQLLVVLAGEPMWRGGLSGTRSLFMHADRPLISGNRTSSMIHELVHIGAGISGAKNSDWIVEGLAEYYASTILYRSGGISETRYREALAWQENWARRADTLFTQRSSGPVTARAVGVMQRLDQALREATDGEATIDNVALALAQGSKKVSLPRLREIVEELAGDEVDLDAIIAEVEQGKD
jgi:predicted metalloprotease with PDZ domain